MDPNNVAISLHRESSPVTSLDHSKFEQVLTNGHQCIHPPTPQITASRYSTNKPANRAISSNAISILAEARKSNLLVYSYCERVHALNWKVMVSEYSHFHDLGFGSNA